MKLADAIAAIGVTVAINASACTRLEIDHQKQTVATLRVNASALHTYRERNGRYPTTVMRLVPLKSLESSLVPTCAKEIYTLDDWGNSFLVWSDEESYAMFSLGKNGQADHQYGERPLEQIAPGPFDDFVGDIVWGPSGGIRWPRGITP